MRQAEKKTVGLAKGGKPYQSTGVTGTPVAPTLGRRQKSDFKKQRMKEHNGNLSDATANRRSAKYSNPWDKQTCHLASRV
ncbi:hypothetical protein ELG93_10445 [Rhizobium ruizarguesonis]|nr:hypothetical protein ELG93_10445 [Rhizobium ruizarguesonis]